MDLESCADAAVALLPQAVRDRFPSAAVDVLRMDLGLAVASVEHLANIRSDGGACDGVSFLKDGVILYAPTPNSRRENFTLAHELGHWLVERATGIYDWIADQRDPGRVLETVCDRIAQRLLLPDELAQAVIADGPIQASHMFSLYANTQASMPVCAIALAHHLPGLGAVAIIDKDSHAVAHASVMPDAHRGWPTVFPWRGQDLGIRHPLVDLDPGDSLTRRMTWRTPWDAQAEFYVDAQADNRRTMVIFSANDLWGVERFHGGNDRDFDTRPLLKGHCCGVAFSRRGYPCPNCGGPFCPRCGDCRCDKQAEREVTCRECFLRFLPHLVVDGVCAECRR